MFSVYFRINRVIHTAEDLLHVQHTVTYLLVTHTVVTVCALYLLRDLSDERRCDGCISCLRFFNLQKYGLFNCSMTHFLFLFVSFLYKRCYGINK